MVNPPTTHSVSRLLDIRSSVFLTAVLFLIAIGGVWELYAGGAHKIHLMSVFAAVLCLALITLVALYFTNRATIEENRLSQERFRMAMAAGKSVAWNLEIQTGQGEWFGDLWVMFGIPASPVKMQLKDFYEYVHPEDRSRVTQVIAEARDNHTDYAAEFRIVQRDGTIHWVNATGKFHYTQKGDPLRMLGIAFDITDRKIAERARIQSEEKFQKAFFSSPTSIAITSMRDHRYIDVNETFEQRTGWRRDEVLGRTPFDINLWVEPSERYSLVNDILKDGQRRLGEFRYRRKDGEEGVALGSAEFIEIEGEPCLFGASLDVTDRHRAEKALRDSEQRFRRVVEHISDAVIVDDLEGRITFANDRFLQLFGFAREQLHTIGLENYIALEYRDELVERHRRRMRGENVPSHFEYEGLRADGTRMWLEVDVVSINDAQGNVVGTQSAIRDITERKRSERALRDSEERLRHLVNSSNDWVWEVDANGVYTYAGPQCRDILGYEPSEIVGRTPFEFMPDDESVRVAAAFKAIAAQRKPFRGLRNSNLHKNGHLVVLETNGVPILDADGTFRGYRGTDRDITERDRAEHALRESEERFRFLANAAPVMIWMSDPSGSRTYVNRPWLDFTGRNVQAELGDGWKRSIHPDDLEAMWMKSKEGFERRQKIEVQYRVRRHDGEYRWIIDNGVPRFNADGTFAGYIGSCIDITERKLAEEAMATMGRRLIEAHEEERTRIARELHDDINQRLALLAVELDRWKETALPINCELHEKVSHAQNRIAEIAKDIQALSHRMHSSKLEYLGLATAASSFCKEFSQQNKIHIDFTHEGVPRNLPPDVSLCLFRVLQEALQNALKYSGDRNFTVNLYGSTHSIELRVADTGVGFDEQEAFTRHGLGLLSMRERLQLVHGEFSVKSKPGAGTTIYARVPLTRDDMQAMAG